MFTGIKWISQALADVDAARRDLNWNACDLARESGLSNTPAYRLIYRHRIPYEPKISTLLKMCRAVGMDMEMIKADPEGSFTIPAVIKMPARKRKSASMRKSKVS